MEPVKRGSLDVNKSPPPLPAGKNYFLGIGVDTYQHFPPLNNARKDVEDLCAALQEHYYFEAAHTTLLTGVNASRKNILRQLSDYRRRLTRDDRLLIYYAGHGLFDDGLGFWVPAEAEREDISSYVGNTEVREIIRNIPARHILLISGSCFSASLLVRDATRDARAFEDFDRNPSRWVFISGKGVVSNGKAGQNSPFAASILKHLHQSTEKAVNIAQLADYVTKTVRFNYEQQAEAGPLYQTGHEGGQFVFRRRQTEADARNTALQINTEGSWLAYLNQYPNGQFADEADKRLADIADERAWAKASDQDEAFAYREYLRKHPKGRYAAEANTCLAALLAAENERVAAQHRAEQAAQQRTEKEQREKAASERAERERRAEQAAQQRTEKEQREKAASERAERERRAEQAAQQRAEKEQREKAASERAEREHRAEQAAQQRAEKEQREKGASERAERERREREAAVMSDRRAESPVRKFPFLPALAGGGGLMLAAVLYAVLSGPGKPTDKPIVSDPKITAGNTAVPPVNTTLGQTAGHTAVQPNPAGTQPDKPAQKPDKTSTPKTTAPAGPTKQERQRTAARQREEERIKQESAQLAEQKQALETAKQTAKQTARGYIKTVIANIRADEPEKATNALEKAWNTPNLPDQIKTLIRSVKASIRAEEYTAAQKKLEEVMQALQ